MDSLYDILFIAISVVSKIVRTFVKIVTDGIGFHPDRIYFLCWIVDWTFNYVAPRSTYGVFAELSMSHSILSNPSNGSHGPALV